jgi:hypothetical protein
MGYPKEEVEVTFPKAQQPLDYAFAITFLVVLLARSVELYKKQ